MPEPKAFNVKKFSELINTDDPEKLHNYATEGMKEAIRRYCACMDDNPEEAVATLQLVINCANFVEIRAVFLKMKEFERNTKPLFEKLKKRFSWLL